MNPADPAAPSKADAVATPEALMEKLLWPRIEGGVYSDSKETIRILAEILGAPRVDPEPSSSAQWAAKLLQTEESLLSKVERDLSNTQLLLHGYVLANWMKEYGDKHRFSAATTRPRNGGRWSLVRSTRSQSLTTCRRSSLLGRCETPGC